MDPKPEKEKRSSQHTVEKKSSTRDAKKSRSRDRKSRKRDRRSRSKDRRSRKDRHSRRDKKSRSRRRSKDSRSRRRKSRNRDRKHKKHRRKHSRSKSKASRGNSQRSKSRSERKSKKDRKHRKRTSKKRSRSKSADQKKTKSPKKEKSKDRKVASKDKKPEKPEKPEKRDRSKEKKLTEKKSKDRKDRKRSRSRHRSKRQRSPRDRRSRDRNDRRDRRPRERRPRRSRSRDRRRGGGRQRDSRLGGDGRRGGRNGRGDRLKWLDSPPKEEASTGGLARGEVMQILEQLQMMHPGMQSLSPAELMKLIQSQNTFNQMQSSRADRKLYLGNLPKNNITPAQLVDILNKALKDMQVNLVPEGNSILSSWISADSNYAFIEFRTPEEASNGFCLNQVSLFGQPLKVGRPRTYMAQQHNTVSPIQQILAGLGGGSLTAMLNPSQKTVAKEVEEAIKNDDTQVQLPTRVLVLKNMIQIPELEIDEEFKDIYEDVLGECQKFGTVVKLVIPRPAKDPVTGAFSQEVPGLGKIFVCFDTVEHAQAARAELTKMLFGLDDNKRIVEGSYLKEEEFLSTIAKDGNGIPGGAGGEGKEALQAPDASKEAEKPTPTDEKTEEKTEAKTDAEK